MKPAFAAIVIAAAALLLDVGPLASQTPTPRPLTLPLECQAGDCPLLRGVPQTAGMRSGFVRLKPGQTVGWHTTGQNEESLVIFRGRGEALIEGQTKLDLAGPGFAYIPAGRRHNVVNTGDEPLEYVYVVAPAASR